MVSESPSIPKGTRDFSPQEMIRRNYIFGVIRPVFEKYGYLPIETPAMENLSTLLGKYGEEGDRLIFKVLNSGDFLSGTTPEIRLEGNASRLSGMISEKGLRYDLTVPFARYVVMHRNEITFPFKRYQVQPVWRADRPQKGRYREFYQCDVDVIGSDALLNEVELVQIIDEIFTRLNVRVTVKLNNRKILAGIADYLGFPDRFMEITIALDKLDKIGAEGVERELAERGLPAEAIEKLGNVLDLKGDSRDKLHGLRSLLVSDIGSKGIEEMEQVLAYLEGLSVNEDVEFDLTLARGLNYYTGTIFEVKSKEVSIGSLCGGGRYDDLTGIFGLPGVSGVGISFGADRIYDVLESLGGFPAGLKSTTDVLLINFGGEEEKHCLKALEELRREGIHAEIYPDRDKIKKQMKYADQKGIPFVVLIGENERKQHSVKLKDMRSGNEESLDRDALASRLKVLRAE